MNSWKIILATVVIFGAGVMTGGLLVHLVDHSHPKNLRRPEIAESAAGSASPTNGQSQPISRTSRLPEVLSKQFLQRLDEELHLTPEQHEAIRKIITDNQNQMRKTMMDARLEIRAELKPEQLKQFEELMKQFRPGGHRPPPETNAPPMAAPTNPPPAV